MRYPVLVSLLSSARQYSTVTSAGFRNLSFAISGGDGRKISSLTDDIKIPRDSGHLLLGVARSGLPSFPQTGCELVHFLRSWCFDRVWLTPMSPSLQSTGVRDCTSTASSSPNGVCVDPHPGRRRRYESCTALLPIYRATFVIRYSLLIPLQPSLWFGIWASCNAPSVIYCSTCVVIRRTMNVPKPIVSDTAKIGLPDSYNYRM
jgi:hypothetical protein